MTTKIKKLICVAVVLIISVGILCACNDDDFRNPRNGEPEAGEFYTLQEAYDNGWLSKGDLRNIAYYYGGDGQRKGFEPTPKNPEELSEETELAIRADWAERNGGENANDNVWQISRLKYCGTYDGLTIVYIHSGAICAQIVGEQKIGGIKFVYPVAAHIIYVWKATE